MPLPHSLIIRPAGLAEAAELARIRVHSWQAGYPGLVPQDVLDSMSVEYDTERTRLRMTDPTLRVGEDWLAWRGDESLGWLGTGTCGDSDLVAHDVGEVLALYVLPVAWGKGVGHALMEFAASRFLDLGFGMSVAWVMEGNARAERFYARQGYEFDGARRPLQLRGIPGHLRRMARQL